MIASMVLTERLYHSVVTRGLTRLYRELDRVSGAVEYDELEFITDFTPRDLLRPPAGEYWPVVDVAVVHPGAYEVERARIGLSDPRWVIERTLREAADAVSRKVASLPWPLSRPGQIHVAFYRDSKGRKRMKRTL